MKQTVKFQTEAYRRLFAEAVRPSYPVKWIVCGAVVIVLMAMAVTIAVVTRVPVAAESPLFSVAQEQKPSKNNIEMEPEVITRTHVETVTVPVSLTVQNPTFEPESEIQNPQSPLAEPAFSSFENPWFGRFIDADGCRISCIRLENNEPAIIIVDNKTQKQRTLAVKEDSEWLWTGEGVIIKSSYADVNGKLLYYHLASDTVYENLSYVEAAEWLKYKWKYNDKQYTYFTKNGCLCRQCDDKGETAVVYQNPGGIVIAGISGKYIYLDEPPARESLTETSFYCLYRVNLLTGEKNFLLRHYCMFPYVEAEGADDVISLDPYTGSVTVHPDGNYTYSGFGEPEDDDNSYQEMESRAVLRVCEEFESGNDANFSVSVDLTEEIWKLIPESKGDYFWETEMPVIKNRLFCCEVYDLMSDDGHISIVYVGKLTDDGLTGGLHKVILPDRSAIYMPFDVDEHYIYFTRDVFDNFTGELTRLVDCCVPYDHPATRDSAE